MVDHKEGKNLRKGGQLFVSDHSNPPTHIPQTHTIESNPDPQLVVQSRVTTAALTFYTQALYGSLLHDCVVAGPYSLTRFMILVII